MLAIIDYGVGNLFSLKCSLDAIGQESVVSGDEAVLKAADRVLLPGVGAFGEAMDALQRTGLDRVVKDIAQRGTPLLGICLGMQLLFERSDESGERRGLGLLKGDVVALRGFLPQGLKIPHMGWNGLDILRPHALFDGIQSGDAVYFVHSYAATGCDCVLATAEYGAPVTAAAGMGNVLGCQFHPEKSGETGLAILRAFCGMRRESA